jgi:hypothetical protein
LQRALDADADAWQIQLAAEGEPEVLIFIPWDGRNPDQLGRQPGSNVILYDPDVHSEAR